MSHTVAFFAPASRERALAGFGFRSELLLKSKGRFGFVS
jgi:hypothetical protein